MLCKNWEIAGDTDNAVRCGSGILYCRSRQQIIVRPLSQAFTDFYSTGLKKNVVKDEIDTSFLKREKTRESQERVIRTKRGQSE